MLFSYWIKKIYLFSPKHMCSSKFFKLLIKAIKLL